MDFSAIDKYLEDNVQNITADLASLVAVPSKRGAASEGKPFGEGCASAMAKMSAIAENAGLKVNNVDNYMLECDLNDSETVLGIIAHLDVVPEGDGWDTNPFELTEKDGALYGRGAIDDKGPAVGALWAVKALRAVGAELPKNVRLLFGSDEESGMEDLEYYRSKKSLPRMMLSPDGEFPVINVEKGVCQLYFKKNYKDAASGRRLLSLKAGRVVNAVPDKAEAVIAGVSEDEVRSVAQDCPKLKISSVPEGVKVLAEGLSAHGSTPEKGINALTGLMKPILALRLEETGLIDAIKGLYELFPYGEGDGEHAGLKMSDNESGALSALLSLFAAENGSVSGGIDIRFPATAKLGEVMSIVKEKLLPLGFELDFFHVMEGHLVPEESGFIKTLLDCFTDVTGLKGHCIAEGGATYLHTVDGGVAYGAEMPGEENNMHGANEHINIGTLLNISKIYARAIYKLCR